MNANDFAGKSALVTGAGRGIGRATAIGLAAAGARVGLLARSSDELSEVAATITEQGGNATVICTDLSDPAQTEAAITETLRDLPSIDILINNAAVVSPLGPTLATDPADLRNVREIGAHHGRICFPRANETRRSGPRRRPRGRGCWRGAGVRSSRARS
jgi:NAD(P)-dependent dehydrogenase (short-subunit alcohol dehydrogenase family)